MNTQKGRPRSRPSKKITTTSGVLFDVERTQDQGQATPAQVRRRRDATNRCPPLGDGRRDVLEPGRASDRWTSPCVLHVEVGRRTAWLYGGRILQLLDRAGVDRRIRDHLTRCWTIPAGQVDNLLVYTEHVAHRFATVEAVDR